MLSGGGEQCGPADGAPQHPVITAHRRVTAAGHVTCPVTRCREVRSDTCRGGEGMGWGGGSAENTAAAGGEVAEMAAMGR